ncbi:hypothetical protein TOREUM_40546 [Tenacibaculum litoreum]|uniref:hypothetical protein n=1 Tax=Tenacibaculum litoreum TaxID=321269 RepID=UPI003894B33A
MKFSKEITLYLKKVIMYDWETFNNLDYLEQVREYKELIEHFRTIIKKNKDLDTSNINNIIDSYQKVFSSLKIEGKSIHFFPPKSLNNGGIFIISKLKHIIEEVNYERNKKSSSLQCECQLALKFNKTPNIKNLDKIGWVNDPYHYSEVFKCKNCGINWVTYINDDSLGYVTWEKLMSKDIKSIKYL